eukprot:m.279032 g.279032  ORF g.279032 m.279032 type:complete len:89 (+) comp19796_c0_seq2:1790-2056(+)
MFNTLGSYANVHARHCELLLQRLQHSVDLVWNLVSISPLPMITLYSTEQLLGIVSSSFCTASSRPMQSDSARTNNSCMVQRASNWVIC